MIRQKFMSYIRILTMPIWGIHFSNINRLLRVKKNRGLFTRFFKFSSSAGNNFLFFAGCLGVLNWVHSIKLIVSSASAANSKWMAWLCSLCSCQDISVKWWCCVESWSHGRQATVISRSTVRGSIALKSHRGIYYLIEILR